MNFALHPHDKIAQKSEVTFFTTGTKTATPTHTFTTHSSVIIIIT